MKWQQKVPTFRPLPPRTRYNSFFIAATLVLKSVQTTAATIVLSILIMLIN